MPPSAIRPDAPFVIVLNAGSGRRDAEAARAAIEGVLAGAGRPFRVQPVEHPERLRQLAAQAVDEARAAGGVVVAAGGDGTINALAQAALGSGCPLGVLPQGTFNYFSRAHGIPSDTVEATRLLLTARPQPVQVGLVNERVFLVNASLGLYPQLLEDREAWKQQFGRTRLVALGAGLATLLREHRQLQLVIELPGAVRRIRTPTLFVGNNRLQLEQIGIEQARVLEAGRLAAITLRPVGTLEMLGLLVRGALGRLGEADQVMSAGFEHMSVRPALPYGRRRIKLATDGEVLWMRTPLDFRVAPQPLWLLKPDEPPADGDKPAPEAST
jgi:diacylglycerol kinase family enzyme